MSKSTLANVFRETLSDIVSGDYECGTEVYEFFPHKLPVVYKTPTWKRFPKSSTETVITVKPMDTFEAAKELGEGVAVLNMASAFQPGGGALKGARAQEEELFRRSNLASSLYLLSKSHTEEFFDIPGDLDEYPLGFLTGIYSDNVTVYREPETYRKTMPFRCAVITMSALKNPKITPDGKYHDKHQSDGMKKKMRVILRIALENGHRKIVLGAFGCGAFHNPPAEVARLWNEVLTEGEFRGVFQEVCFAILDDHNSNGNYQAFKEVFN